MSVAAVAGPRDPGQRKTRNQKTPMLPLTPPHASKSHVIGPQCLHVPRALYDFPRPTGEEGPFPETRSLRSGDLSCLFFHSRVDGARTTKVHLSRYLSYLLGPRGDGYVPEASTRACSVRGRRGRGAGVDDAGQETCCLRPLLLRKLLKSLNLLSIV